VYIRKWFIAESRLSTVDDGPECVGRRRIDIGSDGRRWKRQIDVGSGGSATDDSGRRREMRECDGRRQKTTGVAEAFGRRQKMAVRRTSIAFSAGGQRSCVSPYPWKPVPMDMGMGRVQVYPWVSDLIQLYNYKLI